MKLRKRQKNARLYLSGVCMCAFVHVYVYPAPGSDSSADIRDADI